MKKMAVKVLVPILALLMLLSMASSVKAFVAPTTVPAKLVETVEELSYSIIAPGTTVTTHSGVVLTFGFGIDFITGFTLYIDSSYSLNSYNAGMTLIYNPQTKVETWISPHAVWYMDPPSVGSSNGFAGLVVSTFLGVPAAGDVSAATYAEGYCTLQGFGIFAGETLVLSYAFTPTLVNTWTGFVIMH